MNLNYKILSRLFSRPMGSEGILKYQPFIVISNSNMHNYPLYKILIANRNLVVGRSYNNIAYLPKNDLDALFGLTLPKDLISLERNTINYNDIRLLSKDFNIGVLYEVLKDTHKEYLKYEHHILNIIKFKTENPNLSLERTLEIFALPKAKSSVVKEPTF